MTGLFVRPSAAVCRRVAVNVAVTLAPGPRQQIAPQVSVPRGLIDLASGQRGGKPSEGCGGESQEVRRLFGVHRATRRHRQAIRWARSSSRDDPRRTLQPFGLLFAVEPARRWEEGKLRAADEEAGFDLLHSYQRGDFLYVQAVKQRL